jgi:hypothetical protein
MASHEDHIIRHQAEDRLNVPFLRRREPALNQLTYRPRIVRH